MPRKPARTKVIEHQFYDPVSGEQITLHEEGKVDQRAKRQQHKAGFTMFWLEELMDIPPVPWSAVRTLCALAKFHNRETGTITFRVAAIGQITGDPHESGVSRSIGQLIEAGILYRIARGEVMLNPEVLWIGDPLSKQRAIEKIKVMKEAGEI